VKRRSSVLRDVGGKAQNYKRINSHHQKGREGVTKQAATAHPKKNNKKERVKTIEDGCGFEKGSLRCSSSEKWGVGEAKKESTGRVQR